MTTGPPPIHDHHRTPQEYPDMPSHRSVSARYAVILCAALLGMALLGACRPPASGSEAKADAAATPATEASQATPATEVAAWPASSAQVRPLLLGSALPAANLRTLDAQPVTLKDALNGKPAVLVFYRGGWCPYCNTQLSGLRLIRKDLDALGYGLIAISPDKPEELKKTLDGQALDFQLLSDSQAEAMRGFGIGYRVDAEMLAKLGQYGIDLEKASGETHHVLPVPAVFVVDADGTLQFSFVHPDYKVRVPQDVVLAAAKAIHEQRQNVQPKS
jgi:peroxiredoxin